MGFGVAKPWGDSRRYDFILDNGECLHRIQVKCTEAIRMGAYETRATYTTGKGRAVYTKNDIDFIAAHVVPLDLWYIVPVEVCTPAPMLRFYPHRQARRMRLEPYREAWRLILPSESNHVMDLHASADETHGVFTVHGYSTQLCRAEQSRKLCHSDPQRSGGEESAFLDHEISRLLRAFYRRAPIIHAEPSLAPWPIPRLKLLVPRQGKRLLPEPTEPK
jgi:hypothetical protein